MRELAKPTNWSYIPTCNFVHHQKVMYGLKKQHAANMCIYTVKSVIKYYIHQNSPIITVSLMHPKLLTELVTGLSLRKSLLAIHHY